MHWSTIRPSNRPRRAATSVAAVTIALATAAIVVEAQVPGPNVNMVSGRSLPDGDPFLQRQNEPSGAVSTRNPLHIVSGANDYRTVDLPGLPDGEETGDAWLGVFKSFDGGQTWRSTLIPGYPQDKSPEGVASPLKAYQAGADPTVRAGTNGLFYYSGIAFNRGANGLGVLFLSRFVDDNNAPGKDTVRFLGTAVVASGTKSQFIDKPYMVVDMPRPGARICSIPAATPTGKPQQIPAGTIYISYVVFDGTTKFPHSRVMLTRSADCGVTWSRPSKVSEGAAVNQGVALAIDPNTGEVYLAWRQFANKYAPALIKDGILVARSRDVQRREGGDDRESRDEPDTREYHEPMQFSDPVMVADGIPPFDQGDSTTTFRTNSYPTITVDGASRVYLAWTERGWGPPSNVPPTNPKVPAGDARVVMMTSKNGWLWTPRKPIENTTRNGHQIMPVATTVAGKISVVYYDLREDVAGVFGQYVDDANSPTRRHTLDVRVLQADPADVPAFAPSIQVSRYLYGSLPGEKGKDKIRQLQFNVPNLPLYRLGSTPFIGDFIDIAGQTFVQDASGKWTFNTAPGGPSALHAFWTDNRDVRPPTKGRTWKQYTPPTTTFSGQVCDPGTTGMRNSNIYTSIVTPGLLVGSPSNARHLDATVQRSFVVFAQNNTDVLKRFRFTIAAQPVGGHASFMQFDPVTTLDAQTPARSTASRTVYVTSTDPTANVTVDIVEVELPTVPNVPPPVKPNGLTGAVALNPDVTNPDVTNPDVTNAELFNPDVTNPDVTNPDVTNPDVTNPDVTNPDVTNVVVANPDVTNPDVTNPDVTNPDVTNPDVTNPDVTNTALADGGHLVDATWTLTNKGTVAGSFSVKPFIAKNAPAGTKKQLILHKSYQTLTTVGNGCEIKTVTQLVLVSNVTDLTKLNTSNTTIDPSNPDETNANVWLEPNQSAKFTLRVLPPPNTVYVQKTVTRADGTLATVLVDSKFDPSVDAAPVVQPQAVSIPDVQAGITTPPVVLPLIITTTALPDGLTTQAYSQPLAVTGGVAGAHSWSIVASSIDAVLRPLPPGLTIDQATGIINGVPAQAGAYPFTVQVSDSATPQHVTRQDLVIRIAPLALAQSVTTPEEKALNVALTAADLDNSQLLFAVTQQPSNGTVSGGGAAPTFTPNANYVGADSFAFTASLSTPFGLLTSPQALVSIAVTPVNDPPAFTINPPPAVLEDAGPQGVANTATNFSPGPANESPQRLLAYHVVGNSNAALFSAPPAIDNAGMLTYTPAANAYGTAVIDVTAQDDGGTAGGGIDTSAPQTFTITVTAVNDAPSFAGGPDQAVYDTAGPQTIPGWATAISAGPPNESGQTLAFQATAADVSLFAVQPAIDATTGTLTYTPKSLGANGSTIVTVTLKDNGGIANGGVDTSAARTFTVTVTHRAPVANADSYSTNEDMPFTLGGVCTAPINYAGFSPTSPFVSTAGDASFTATDADGAVLRLISAGNGFTFNQHGAAWTRPPISLSNFHTMFQFRATGNAAPYAPDPIKGWDGQGPGPDGLVFVLQNASAGVLALGGRGGDLVGGITQSVGVEFDTYQSPEFNDPDSNHIGIDLNGSNVSVATVPVATRFDNGALWTVWIDYHGSTLQVRASPDGIRPETPTLSYGIDLAAVLGASSATAGFVAADGSNIANVDLVSWTSTCTVPSVLTNDTNAGGSPLTAILFSPATNGTVQLSGDGRFTYTPAPNFFGIDTFAYSASDGVTASAPAIVTMTVNPVNDAPSFVKGADQSATGNGQPVSVGGWATAISAGPANEASQTVSFTVTNDNNTLFAAAPQVDSSGALTFTPAAGQSGTAAVTIVAHDNGGTANGGVDTSAPQTITITVKPSNRPPVATSDSYSAVRNGGSDPALVGFWPFNEANGAALDLSGHGNNGALVGAPLRTTDVPAAGSLYSMTFNGAGDFVEVPDAPSLEPTTVVTLAAWVKLSAPNTATHGIISKPTSGTGWALRVEGGRANFGLNNGFINASFGGSLPQLPQGQWTHLAATFQAATSGPGTVKIYQNGQLVLTDSASAIGQLPVSTQPLQIGREFAALGGRYFAGAIDEPRVYNRVLSDAEIGALVGNYPLTVAAPGVLTNDTDPDSDLLHALLVTPPSHGTLNLNSDGSFTYAPTADFIGTDAFAYKTTDGVADSNTVTVTITTTNANNAPSFAKGPDISVPVNAGSQTFPNWATALWRGGTAVACPPIVPGSAVASSTWGGRNGPDAVFDCNPKTEWNSGSGNASVQAQYAQPVTFRDLRISALAVPGTYEPYTVSASNDGVTWTAIAQALPFIADESIGHTTFDVATPVTTAPYIRVAVGDNASWVDIVDAALIVSPEQNQQLTFHVSAANPSLFSVQPSIDANGTLAFTPAIAGSTTVTVTLQDDGGTANGGSDTSPAQTFTITVTSVVSQAPVAHDDTATTSENTPVTIHVTANDTDVYGDPLVVDGFSGASNASIANVGNGDMRYTPPLDFAGAQMFTYHVRDNHGGVSNDATVTVTVVAIVRSNNRGPGATSVSYFNPAPTGDPASVPSYGTHAAVSYANGPNPPRPAVISSRNNSTARAVSFVNGSNPPPPTSAPPTRNSLAAPVSFAAGPNPQPPTSAPPTSNASAAVISFANGGNPDRSGGAGSSASRRVDVATYASGPTITDVSPHQVSASGPPPTLMLTGANFTSVTTVTLSDSTGIRFSTFAVSNQGHTLVVPLTLDATTETRTVMISVSGPDGSSPVTAATVFTVQP